MKDISPVSSALLKYMLLLLPCNTDHKVPFPLHMNTQLSHIYDRQM